MPNFLNRYTDLPALIHILNTKCVTLLDPLTWDDKNDSYFMAEYKERHGARTLLALCFSEAEETYHHWRVFSHGSQGVCIKFDKAKFLKQFEVDGRIKHGKMRYAVRSLFAAPKTIRLEELPFLKRRQYEDEKEYRVIYLNKETEHRSKDYRINIDWISRITLSPWLPLAMAEVSREEVRRRALCQAATAEETQHVLERLAYLGFVRADLARERVGRATTHWLVNPALAETEKPVAQLA